MIMEPQAYLQAGMMGPTDGAMMDQSLMLSVPMAMSGAPAPIDIPEEELQKMLDYVAQQEQALLQQMRRDPNYQEAEQSLQLGLDAVRRREHELIRALGRPPDWKEYMLPVLASAYILKDDPETLGMVLGASILGYEQWRRAHKDRYMQALLDLQSEKLRVLNAKRLLENQNLSRVRHMLSQARMLFNNLSQRQMRDLSIRLRQQSQERMMQLREEREQHRRIAHATRFYWSTFKHMEDLIREYPAQREEIYRQFEPVLDQYATVAGIEPIHTNLGAVFTRTASVSEMMRATRWLRATTQLQAFRQNPAGLRGAMLGTYGDTDGFLTALVRGDFRSAARTARDIQTVLDTLDTVASQIVFIPDTPAGRSRLIGYARMLGSTRQDLESLPHSALIEHVDALINRLRETMFMNVAVSNADDLSQSMQQALMQATGLSGNSLDEAIQKAIENNVRAIQSIYEAAGGTMGAAVDTNSSSVSQATASAADSATQFYTLYQNEGLVNYPGASYREVSSRRLVHPYTVYAAPYVRDDPNAPQEVRARAQAIASTDNLTVRGSDGNLYPLILRPNLGSNHAPNHAGFMNVAHHKGSNQFVPVLVIRAQPVSLQSGVTIDARAAISAAQRPAVDGLRGSQIRYPYAMDLAWWEDPQQPGQFVPQLIISRRVPVGTNDGVRVSIIAIPLVGTEWGTLVHSPQLEQLGIKVDSAATGPARESITQFLAFLEKVNSLRGQYNNPQVRQQLIREFQQLGIHKNAVILWTET
jgi:hypothetical protein